MSILFETNCSDWHAKIDSDTAKTLTEALEAGSIIFLPKLHFELLAKERFLLSESIMNHKQKNVSFDAKKNQLSGSQLVNGQAQVLHDFMQRFANSAKYLVEHLFPTYQATLDPGRTSYRPVEAKGRESSAKKDDTRLHVDAFVSSPTQGKRILRVFSNINPDSKPRHWRAGQAFSMVAERFVPKIKKPILGSRTLLNLFGLTKTYRSDYDHYMLNIHDKMKLDDDYQKLAVTENLYLPANSTWIVLTDVVSHAAISGQFMLEQTFYFPQQAMYDSSRAPEQIIHQYL